MMNIIESIFYGISFIITILTIVLVVILYLELALYTTKTKFTKKGLLISLIAFIGCLVCGYLIYETFGIYPWVNVGIYENIFFQALQLTVSILTIILVIWLIFLFVFYSLGLNTWKTKPAIILTVGALAVIGFSVFWIYQMTGLLLFTNLSPFIYS